MNQKHFEVELPEVLRSLRILAEAKRLGLIPAVKPFVYPLRAAGYWIAGRYLFIVVERLGPRRYFLLVWIEENKVQKRTLNHRGKRRNSS